MSEIVILTPSFNRANTLPRLYGSLKEQNDNNFTWLIVDDGSLDDTKVLIDSMIKENTINIKYIYQNNGGKARALNKGFLQCENASIFVVVDSDDYLLSTAIQTIKRYLLKYNEKRDIGAFFFHYYTHDGKILKPRGKIIENDYIMTPYQYNNTFRKHDGCIAYLSRVTKKYKYPEFEGETYIGPTILQMEMSDEFKMVYSPTVIGVAEYQRDGLTMSGRKLRLKNPLGMIHYSKLMMSPKSNILNQIKYAISIWPYAKLAKKSFCEVVKMIDRPFMLLSTYIPGQILSIYWDKMSKK